MVEGQTLARFTLGPFAAAEAVGMAEAPAAMASEAAVAAAAVNRNLLCILFLLVMCEERWRICTHGLAEVVPPADCEPPKQPEDEKDDDAEQAGDDQRGPHLRPQQAREVDLDQRAQAGGAALEELVADDRAD